MPRLELVVAIERVEEQVLRVAVGLLSHCQESQVRHLNIGQDADGRLHGTVGAADLGDPGGGAADRPSVNCARRRERDIGVGCSHQGGIHRGLG